MRRVAAAPRSRCASRRRCRVSGRSRGTSPFTTSSVRSGWAAKASRATCTAWPVPSGGSWRTKVRPRPAKVASTVSAWWPTTTATGSAPTRLDGAEDVLEEGHAQRPGGGPWPARSSCACPCRRPGRGPERSARSRISLAGQSAGAAARARSQRAAWQEVRRRGRHAELLVLARGLEVGVAAGLGPVGRARRRSPTAAP